MKRVAVLLVLLACSTPEPKPAPKPEAKAVQKVEPPAPAVEVATREHHGLPWYEDSYAAALAKLGPDQLLFVDLWAAWCHTCKSMREYVLTAEHFADTRQRLVFLALDTERASNAPVLKQLPLGAWPTFYLLDREQHVFGRYVGAMSPGELSIFVRDALRSYDTRKDLVPGDPLALLLEADRLMTQEKLVEARAAYERTLAESPQGWVRRADAWVGLASVLRKLQAHEACIDVGRRGLAQTGSSARATDFSYQIVECLAAAPDAALALQLQQRLRQLCEQGDASLTPDDRGDACGLAAQLASERKDDKAARVIYARRLTVLESAAAGMPDEVAATYDSARVETLLALGRAQDALTLVSQRERALPDDYNPPHQRAKVLRALARPQEALQALDRALAKVAGPRRAGMLGMRVDLLLADDRKEDARATLREQLAAYQALPEGQRQPHREAAVQARLQAF